MLIMFFVIRILNFYGDPIPFQQYDSFLLTLFSFINCHKYPPSLLFLLMTLSLPLMLLGYTDRMNSHKNIIVYMGYNPLLMYIVHLYVLRIIKKFILSNTTSLLIVYAIALLVVMISLAICHMVMWITVLLKII